MIKNLIKLLRPEQWLKNIFVFLPIFFHGDIFDIAMLWKAIIAFFSFCFAASSIYCLNDILDVKADRMHPRKCKRPIASGVVSIHVAYCFVLLMISLSLILAYCSFEDRLLEILVIIGGYYLMNLAYCLKLKQVVLVDVFIISIGFVLRVELGGMINGIEPSCWLVVMTFLLALFLAFAKRRDDVVLFQRTGSLPRKNVNRYNLEFMNQVITLVATITLIAYIMYSVSNEVMTRFGSHKIYLTSIFVLAGILRYLQLTIVDVKSGSPTKILYQDRFLQLCIVGWILAFIMIIYF